MKDEDERRLEEALGRFRQPPALDRESLWLRIDGALHRRRRIRRAIAWGSAIAAAAILGVLVGRFGLDRDTPAPAPAPIAEGTELSPYHAVLAATFRDAIHLLEDFDPSTASPETTADARHTLANVRLLMELARGRDASTAALLRELELVLAQALYEMETRSPEGAARVEQAVRRRGLAGRMRDASPRIDAGAVPVGI